MSSAAFAPSLSIYSQTDSHLHRHPASPPKRDLAPTELKHALDIKRLLVKYCKGDLTPCGDSGLGGNDDSAWLLAFSRVVEKFRKEISTPEGQSIVRLHLHIS